MNVRFLPLASQELDDAFDWYQQQADGLGFELLDELDRVVRRVRLFPESCAVLVDDLRRAQLSRFPYGVIYGVEPDTLVVVAVAHLHREPFYWIDRDR
jgi:plasmid stabilization system protein ParE